MFYVRLMVITAQKPLIDTQKIKGQESEHRTAENPRITKEGTNRRRKE